MARLGGRGRKEKREGRREVGGERGEVGGAEGGDYKVGNEGEVKGKFYRQALSVSKGNKNIIH